MLPVDGRFVHFEFLRKSESGKTDIYVVKTNDTNSSLGTIEWYGKFRKYSFFPDENTVFEHICLNDIINFLRAIGKKEHCSECGIEIRTETN